MVMFATLRELVPGDTEGGAVVEEQIEDEHARAYGRRVGDRLRAIRRQKRLSLQDVEAASRLEFKASVLGAYERGERAISVPRLQRLSRFYNVPVDQLLPPDEGPSFGTDGETIDLTEKNRGASPIAIDLARLEQMDGTEAAMLIRYLQMIQVQRQDFNGRVLTIRSDDLKAIACILDTTTDATGRRLEELGLRFQRQS
ncbi:MAG: transcriptional regulator [Acidimicrobiia bacterium]